MISPVLDPNTSDSIGQGRWIVVIYNNETNSVDEVVSILVRATGCDIEEAAIETWEAHTYGKAPVHFAELKECERAAAVIQSIGVRTSVCREWEE